MTVLEKAARAVHAKLVEGAVHSPDFDAVVASEREIIYEVTRAVLMAIREPDAATVDQGYEEDVWGFPAPLFTAMIDHILEDTGVPTYVNLATELRGE